MTTTPGAGAAPAVATPEEVGDNLRAGVYSLLGELLEAPPAPARLQVLAGIDADAAGATPLTAAWRALADAARDADADAVEQEFNDLFIGLGRGELVPYGSYYLTGFLNEKPLAALRDDLARLRIARPDTVKEPEDHIALVLQAMALLLAGDPPAGADEQAGFFDRHLGPWASRFFDDLATADSARFYRGVAALGRAFVALDSRYMAMPA